MWPISNTLNIKLRKDRAFGGSLDYWRDARGLHEPIMLGLWAFQNQLPYGKEAPFGRDGNRQQLEDVGRLRLPPSEGRLQHQKAPAGAATLSAGMAVNGRSAGI
jgi:hypothetical protein